MNDVITSSVERAAVRSTSILALDGVRGLAIGSVVWFHFRPDQMPGGWMGMSIFFPLSGFLVTLVMARAVEASGQLSVRTFWSRRVRRLFPALFVMLAVVVAALVAAGRWLRDDLGAVVSALAYVNNWWQLRHATDYWALFSGRRSAFEHLWSLSVEEQFYLAWPLVVWLVTRRRRPAGSWATLLGVAVAASLAGLALGLWLGLRGSSMTAVYYNTGVRAGELMAGSALAIAVTRRPEWFRAQRTWLQVSAGAVLATMVVLWLELDRGDWLVRHGGMFVAGLGTCIVIAAAVASGPVTALLEVRPLRWLGTRCYGIYLWHWPVVVLVDERSIDLRGVPLLSVRIALTAALTVLSYWVVEDRFRPRRASGDRPGEPSA